MFLLALVYTHCSFCLKPTPAVPDTLTPSVHVPQQGSPGSQITLWAAVHSLVELFHGLFLLVYSSALLHLSQPYCTSESPEEL